MTTPCAATQATVHGLPVAVLNTRPDIETSAVLQRLEAVLELIQTYQPRRYRLLKRDLAGFVVQRYACRGAYLPPSHTCLVELTFLANAGFSDAQIAASIVHEATHARLHRLGLALTSAEAERVCRRAEIALGRAVPNGDAVIARAEESLALADSDVAPEVDWDLARRRVAAVDREALSVPGAVTPTIATNRGRPPGGDS
jgi:hypothetical protein